jgi:hypothetical protein
MCGCNGTEIGQDFLPRYKMNFGLRKAFCISGNEYGDSGLEQIAAMARLSHRYSREESMVLNRLSVRLPPIIISSRLVT